MSVLTKFKGALNKFHTLIQKGLFRKLITQVEELNLQDGTPVMTAEGRLLVVQEEPECLVYYPPGTPDSQEKNKYYCLFPLSQLSGLAILTLVDVEKEVLSIGMVDPGDQKKQMKMTTINLKDVVDQYRRKFPVDESLRN